MPLEKLRRFMQKMVARWSLRYVEAVTGVGHETIRKFTEGETETPNQRSIEAYTRLYWQQHRTGRVAEDGSDGLPLVPVLELRRILPEGLDGAVAALRAMFDPESPNPPEAAELERWLLRLINSAYGAGPHYQKGKRRKKE